MRSRYSSIALKPGRHGARRAGRLFPALAVGIALDALAGAIVVDGTTATTVATGGAGKLSVAIAPAQAGVSYNAYAQFNVGRAGVDLINTGVNARYIVSEVTGTMPTAIEGPLAVVGPRANLILANPNGITVNGAQLINFGSVALSTGKLGFNDFTPAPGVLQRNLVLATERGALEIGPAGLAGALINLELIAKQLRVNGPLTNSFDSASARLRTVVGTSRAEFDTSISPTDNLHDWVAYSGAGVASATATLLDITAQGSLAAGRIQIAVNDAGAGVRHAGSALATHGDFALASSGELRVDGGRMRAARDLVIDAPALAAQHPDIEAERNAELRAGAISLSGGRLAAGADVLLGVPDVAARALTRIDGTSIRAGNGLGLFALGQPIELCGATLGAGQNIVARAASVGLANAGATASKLVSTGGAVLIETAGDIHNRGGLIQGAQRAADASFAAAVTLRAGGSVINESPHGAALAVVFGSADDVLVSAGRDIANRSGRLISNRNLSLTAGADVINGVERIGGIDGGAQQPHRSRSRNVFGISKRTTGFSVDYGALTSAGEQALLVADGELSVTGRNLANRGGELIANAGDIRLSATAAIRNEGLATGQVRFERSCRLFICKTRAHSDVSVIGGLLNASGNLELRAGERIENIGGRVLALGELTLDAPKVSARSVTVYSLIKRASGLKALFGDSWAQVYAADQGGVFTAQQGWLRISGAALNEGGVFAAAEGTEAAGGIVTLRGARRDPVRLDDHLGLTSWGWR